MTLEQLDQLLGATTWEQFEATTYGTIQIHAVGQLLVPITFTMRVGLFFGKPMQAIMVLGQFIRMRDVGYYEQNINDFELEELNPNKLELIQDWRPKKRWQWFNGYTVLSNRNLYGVLTVT